MWIMNYHLIVDRWRCLKTPGTVTYPPAPALSGHEIENGKVAFGLLEEAVLRETGISAPFLEMGINVSEWNRIYLYMIIYVYI